jgi:Transposase, Mutator family
VVNVWAVIATAVNVEGRREIIGFDMVTTETTAGWTAFLRSLVARGLGGVEGVISDAHGGSKPRSRRCSARRRASAAERSVAGRPPIKPATEAGDDSVVGVAEACAVGAMPCLRRRAGSVREGDAQPLEGR